MEPMRSLHDVSMLLGESAYRAQMLQVYCPPAIEKLKVA